MDEHENEQQGWVDYDDLMEARRELAVPYLDRELRFSYDPNLYTTQLQSKMEKFGSLPLGDSRRSEIATSVILGVVTEWNFRHRDGSPVPINITTVSRLALPVRINIAAAINVDLGLAQGPKPSSGIDLPTLSRNGMGEPSRSGGPSSDTPSASG